MRLGLGIGLPLYSFPFAVPDAPTFTSLLNAFSAAVGDSAGLQYTIPLIGTGFSGGGLSDVLFGGVSADSVVVTSDTTADVVPPALSNGLHNIELVGPGGSSGVQTNYWRAWNPLARANNEAVLRGTTLSAGLVASFDDISGNSRSYSAAGTKPAHGTLNTYDFVEWDGTNKRLTNSGVVGTDLMTTTAFTHLGVFRIDTYASNTGASFQNTQVWGDPLGDFGLPLFTTGSKLGIYNWDGGDKHDDIAPGTSWFIGKFQKTGGKLYAATNNNSFGSGTSATATSGLGVAIAIGANPGAGKELDGAVAELLWSKDVWDATDLGYYASYALTRYFANVAP